MHSAAAIAWPVVAIVPYRGSLAGPPCTASSATARPLALWSDPGFPEQGFSIAHVVSVLHNARALLANRPLLASITRPFYTPHSVSSLCRAIAHTDAYRLPALSRPDSYSG